MNTPRFSIVPKASLGDIHLGSTLNTILKQTATIHHRLIYSGDSILTTPYILQLSQFGIQLIFNQTTQRLVIIELSQLGALELSYQGKTIREWDIKKVYNDVFGPTYQGVIVGDDTYILSYPGISFKFELLDSEKDKGLEAEMLGRLLERNAKVLSMVIHPYKQFTDWDSSLSCSHLTKQIEIDKLVVDRPHRVITVEFLKHPQNLKQFELKLNKSNQQDVLCTLGPPDDTFLKVDNRTQIHSSSLPRQQSLNSSINDEDGLVFHNYFHYGFDLLYSNSLLIKIIIHNNSPLNKLLFGKYEKCPFEIITNYEERVTGDMSFGKIKWWIEPKKLESIIINRSNKIVGNDIELIDSFDVEDENGEDHHKNGYFEVKSLCYVDAENGFNWDVFGGNNANEKGARDGIIDSLTVY